MFLHTQMPFAFRIGQRVHEGLIHPFRRTGIDSHAHGQLICCSKRNSCQLTQLIRMVSDNIHGLFTILTVQFYCTIR